MPTVVEHLSTPDATLTVVATDLSGDDNARIPAKLNEVWRELAPHVPSQPYMALVRDLPEWSIDGQHPGGSCYHRQELSIALPSWGIEDRELIASFAHEAHHMARWNHTRVSCTLGETLVSEGLACMFEERHAGQPPQWAIQSVPRQAIDDALVANWEEEDWDHSSWFFHGPHGRWIGYSLGYRLARAITKQQGGFDIRASLTMQPDTFQTLLATDPAAFAGPLA